MKRIVCMHWMLMTVLVVSASADLPVPIKDINSRTAGTSMELGAEMNGYIYYKACPDRYGCELFRTPIGGTGAELVRDITAGSSGSNPSSFVNADGTLFFLVNGNRLWKSDGTVAGTQSVKSYSSVSGSLTPFGSQVLFQADRDNFDTSGFDTGFELQTSDGTPSGTVEHELCPGVCSGAPSSFAVSGSRVFFRATDAEDTELWKYEAGTPSQVGDINPGLASSFPNAINAFGSGGAIFFANDASGFGVWTSDGSTNTKVGGSASTPALVGADEMVVAGSLAYFNGNGSGQGFELWMSNGTAPGTVPVKDINFGTGGSWPEDFTAVGSSVFFTADDGVNGRELWVSTGTAMNTVPLELVAGAGAPTLRGATFTDLNGSELFFVADDGSGAGQEPWKSNGTPGGTTIIGDLDPGPDSAGIEDATVAAQNSVFFSSSALDDGDELWRTDGVAALKLTDIGTMTSGSGIQEIVSLGGFGYFCADDGFTGTELWKTDGTSAGTVRLEDIAPGSSSGCDDLVASGGLLYFTAYDGSTWGLWKSGGSLGGASLLEAFAQPPQHLTAHAGELFFAADGGAGTGQELWKSDGTIGNTMMVEDIYLGTTGSNPRNLVSTSSYLYFAARSAVNSTNFAFNDVEVHRSDGTVGGTFLVADVYSGTSGSFPTDFAELGSEVLFAARDSGGTKLWKTNGMQGNLTLLKNIVPADPPVVLGSNAYLAANDGVNGTELWKTDGSPGNTTMVQNIRSDSSSSSPQELTVAGSILLFTAIDDDHGRELWTTDGSTTGLLKDIYSDGSGSSPRALFPTGIGNSAYFSADDGSGGGRELWITDGTTGGTTKVADLSPDGSSSPESFAMVGSTIVFSAAVGSSGDELWSFGAADCGDAPDPDYPTTVQAGGACHRVGENTLVLGTDRDADSDGQPTAGSDGDDLDGTDDEDGVVFTSLFNLGDTATFNVTLSAAGRLNAWIDWNRDGDWEDNDEHVIYNEALAGGTHGFSVEVPESASTGTSPARFRLDSAGTTYPGGTVFDGEVEDHEIEIVELFDFGDAPDPLVATAGEYPTLLVNDGARHRLKTGIYLGSGVDAESDGQAGVGATGDDSDGINDDDGVTFTTSLQQGANASVEVVVSVEGYVSAWVDFDQNGVWNSSEEMIIEEEQLAAGAHVLDFPVPAGAPGGTTYARFRFDTNSDGYEPIGWATDGEVEDYQVFVGIAPLLADAGIDRSIAPNNQSIALGGMPAAAGGTPPYNYSWSISPGTPGVDYSLSSSTAENPIFTGLSEQVFTAMLTVTDNAALQDSDSATVTVEVPDQRDLFNETLTGTETYEACGALTAELVTIADGALIVLRAPLVILGDDVMTEAGGTLIIENTAPSSCLP